MALINQNATACLTPKMNSISNIQIALWGALNSVCIHPFMAEWRQSKPNYGTFTCVVFYKFLEPVQLPIVLYLLIVCFKTQFIYTWLNIVHFYAYITHIL